MVGIDEPEVKEISDRLDCAIVAYQYLPRLKLVEGKLWVESRTHGDYMVDCEGKKYLLEVNHTNLP